MNLDLDEQIKLFNRLAKRTNRQIRTFKKSGYDNLVAKYFPELHQSGNVRLIKKKATESLKAMKPANSQQEMTRAYSRLVHDVHGGVTYENIDKIDTEMRKVKDAMQLETIKPEEYYAYKEAEKYAKHTSYLYYELFKYGHERGYYKSFSPEHKPKVSTTRQFYGELRRINRAIEEKYNGDVPDELKQSEMRVKGDLAEAAKEYYMKDLRKDFTKEPPKEYAPKRINIYVSK